MGKIVVVGSGFSGAVIAREIAEKLDKPVIVLEKRSHIAGNMYDELDEHGILVQKYGPHVLVTDEWKVIDYLSNFADMMQYTVKELSYMDGKYVRLPFNFESIQQMIGYPAAEKVIRKLRSAFYGRDRVPIQELCSNEDKAISEFGNLLFEKAFRTYCAKQWDIDPAKLDISIMGRSAIAMGYDERYMNKDFQFLPCGGFTEMFRRLLEHPNISVELNCDALQHLKLDESTRCITLDGEPVEMLIYTGAVDELFGCCYGELPYRSLDIRYEWFDREKMYPEKIISYPQADGYTRRTEYKFMMQDYSVAVGTTIATEYPIAYVKGGVHAPFYPVITEETKVRYAKYKEKADRYENVFLCGRLADFKYYNMDDCILHALEVFEEIKRYCNKRICKGSVEK